VSQIGSQALYGRFERARRDAIVATDLYHELSPGDARRESQWQRVVEQTEAARQLPEAWLCVAPDSSVTSTCNRQSSTGYEPSWHERPYAMGAAMTRTLRRHIGVGARHCLRQIYRSLGTTLNVTGVGRQTIVRAPTTG